MSDGLKVFILGSARSGTSVMCSAMRTVFQLPGRGESHVLPAFQGVMHQFFTYAKSFADSPGMHASQLSPRDFQKVVDDYIRTFYGRHYKNGRWVDKTPGAQAINSVRLIARVFPDAHTIAMRRNGIEVVQSFTRKFSSEFEEACNAWRNYMKALADVRLEFPQLIEIDQYDLTNAPDAVATRIADTLGQPEKAGPLSAFFAEQRVETSSSHDWTRRLTLDDVDWTPEQRATFMAICGNAMHDHGYWPASIDTVQRATGEPVTPQAG